MIKETTINVADMLNAQSKGATHLGIDENGKAIHFQGGLTKVQGQRGLWKGLDENGDEVFVKKGRR